MAHLYYSLDMQKTYQRKFPLKILIAENFKALINTDKINLTMKRISNSLTVTIHILFDMMDIYKLENRDKKFFELLPIIFLHIDLE